ncbi:hypothetical protein FB451DRAFT_1043484 [Mycena latifolia]|nr:hypothetical protein FB451DRAFT_1043484 [Mycena latifolia]
MAPPQSQNGPGNPNRQGGVIKVVHTDDAATKLNDRVRRRCFNCRMTDTSTWRRSSLTPGKVLCNKCGLFERTHSRPRPEQFPHKRGPLASSTLRSRSPPPGQGQVSSRSFLPYLRFLRFHSCCGSRSLHLPLSPRVPPFSLDDASFFVSFLSLGLVFLLPAWRPLPSPTSTRCRPSGASSYSTPPGRRISHPLAHHPRSSFTAASWCSRLSLRRG